MAACQELTLQVGNRKACKSLGIARSTFYRNQRPMLRVVRKRPSPPRKLSNEEKRQVLAVLHSQRFVDKSPAEVWATLLDENKYLCSERTMYRILHENMEVRDRRNQRRHPEYKKPELLATGPNQVWSWDITKIRGPQKWNWFYLYVILDIYSRYVVGWMLATRELAALSKKLIASTIEDQNVDPKKLTIHADNGSPMKAKCVAQLLADLGTTRSHNRPYVSDDNPFSESQFKTMKYSVGFPDRFSCMEDALSFFRDFFPWYNKEHRHGGIGLLTPEMVHYGTAKKVLENRHDILKAAYQRHPERFLRGIPKQQFLHEKVWINQPKKENAGH